VTWQNCNSIDGYGDVGDEEFGANDNEGRNGEDSSSAKQAEKRKAINQ
jgi:hypothetical protein